MNNPKQEEVTMRPAGQPGTPEGLRTIADTSTIGGGLARALPFKVS